MLGAFVGATLVWLHYLPHWKETPDPDLKRACFCTAPAIRNRAPNLASEIIATLVLVFVAAAIFSKACVHRRLALGLAPILSRAWFGESGFPSAGPPAMRSIPRATWHRESPMRFFPLLAKENPIGRMRRCR